MKKKTSTTRKPVKAKIGAANGNVPVSRMFFAVLPKGYSIDMMQVGLLATTRQMAIRLYEHWNDGMKWNSTKENVIVKVEAKNFC